MAAQEAVGTEPTPRHRAESGRPSFVEDGDIDAARALVDEATDAELFLYPGDQHLFADSSVPSYDADASALPSERVLGFLGAR